MEILSISELKHTGNVCVLYILHRKHTNLCILPLSLANANMLTNAMSRFTQEGCMKAGDRLLAVNGESVLGYSVEKVGFDVALEMTSNVISLLCVWDIRIKFVRQCISILYTTMTTIAQGLP